MSTAANGSPLIIGLNGSTISLDSCTIDTCSLQYAEVRYVPSFSANLAYLIIFGAVLLAQTTLGVMYRTWSFLVGMSCGLILEIVGYIGRLGLHSNPFSFGSFVTYLTCLTIGPAFFSASIYICLSRLVVIHGPNLARFKPRTYTVTFICCDIVSLILQAAGGAIAATATATATTTKNLGVHVMIAGLVFQVCSLALFMVLSLDFARRVKRAGPDSGEPEFYMLRQKAMFKLFPFALALATLTIFIRCTYRVAELQGGFGGKLANNQLIFLIFEGPMIIAAVCALTVFHPGHTFASAWKGSKQTKSIQDVESLDNQGEGMAH